MNDKLSSKPDGRQLRRTRNRDAVVEALLDLYRDGNLQPSTEEIASRSGLSPRSLFRYFDDVDDLARTAMMRQLSRVRALVPIETGTEAPFEVRVEALVEQRLALFGAAGNAAEVTRLRAPFQPSLAQELARNRNFLRSQIKELFALELSVLAVERAERVLAAADVLTNFESYQFLIRHRTLSIAETRTILIEALTAILKPSH